MIPNIKNFIFALFILTLSYFTGCHGIDAALTRLEDVPDKVPDLDPNSFNFPNAEEPANPLSTRCGGILTSINVTIEKSLFDPVLPNERCVWIIASPNASAYDVEAFFGHNSSHRHLTVAGITRRSNVISHTHPAVSGKANRIYANILVITFQSGSSNRSPTGFSLRASRVSSSAVISSSSRYEILESSSLTGHAVLKHPANSDRYDNNELSAFVFPPRNNLAETEMRNIIYREIAMEPEKFDWLSVNVLNATTGVFDYKGSIVGGANPIPISSNDIILLVFHSDNSNTYGGFYLAAHYSKC